MILLSFLSFCPSKSHESWVPGSTLTHTSLVVTVSGEAALASSGVTHLPACQWVRDKEFKDGFVAGVHQPLHWGFLQVDKVVTGFLPCTVREGTCQCMSLLPGCLHCLPMFYWLEYMTWPNSDSGSREDVYLSMKPKGRVTCAYVHNVVVCFLLPFFPWPQPLWDLRNYWPPFPTSDVEIEAQKNCLAYNSPRFHSIR